jgi:hypothetical protein
METPLHAANEVDKDETLPKIVAAVAGIALLAIAAGALIYSGIWSPPPTNVATQTHK